MGGPGFDGMGGRLLKVGDPEAAAADWVLCRSRRHDSAPLHARAARHACPGSVRAVATGQHGHRVAGGGPDTSVPGAGVPGTARQHGGGTP